MQRYLVANGLFFSRMLNRFSMEFQTSGNNTNQPSTLYIS